jgi:hypothetical protein
MPQPSSRSSSRVGSIEEEAVLVIGMRGVCPRDCFKALSVSLKGGFVTAVSSSGVSGIAGLTAQIAVCSRVWILWANSPSSSSRTSLASPPFSGIFCLFEVGIMGGEHLCGEVDALARPVIIAIAAARAAFVGHAA